jgi:hypothetical protein
MSGSTQHSGEDRQKETDIGSRRSTGWVQVFPPSEEVTTMGMPVCLSDLFLSLPQ